MQNFEQRVMLEMKKLIRLGIIAFIGLTFFGPGIAQAEGERFAFITHASDSDPWWNTIKNAIKHAEADLNVKVDYRSPPNGDLADMARLIEQAAARNYDGVIVTIADFNVLKKAIQKVTRKGIPVITVNSGTHEESRKLGAKMHIGQPEYDAGYGDAGHVWANAARDVGAGVRAEGGFLIQLGSPDVHNPRLAEVYSFPFVRVPEDGTVRLIVEVDVTPATCGKKIEGRMIQLSAEGDMSSMNISLAMPDCGGDQGFLVLKNLVQDLKIVRNRSTTPSGDEM